MAGKELIKENWKAALKEKAISDPFGNQYVNKKTLANILGVSENKIYFDIENESLNAIKMGKNGSKAEVRIYLKDAFIYIDSFN